MSRKKPRNRSARDRQRARQDAARTGRCAEPTALAAARYPFRGYRQWLTPRAQARPEDMAGLPEKAALVLGIVVDLAPLYGGQVPLAAIYLEQQIRSGVLRLATAGGGATAVPVPDMATVLAGNADRFPGELALDADGCDARQLLHELHAAAALFLDDDQMICLAARV